MAPKVKARKLGKEKVSRALELPDAEQYFAAVVRANGKMQLDVLVQRPLGDRTPPKEWERVQAGSERLRREVPGARVERAIAHIRRGQVRGRDRRFYAPGTLIVVSLRAFASASERVPHVDLLHRYTQEESRALRVRGLLSAELVALAEGADRAEEAAEAAASAPAAAEADEGGFVFDDGDKLDIDAL